VGCLLSLHACTRGLMQAPSPSSPPTTDEMHLIIALFAPLDSPDFLGFHQHCHPAAPASPHQHVSLCRLVRVFAACNCYQLLFDRPVAARRATAHSPPSTGGHHSPTAHAFSSIKTRLIRPSARRASSQPALAALQTESSPVFCLLTLDFLSPAAL
jgi:hypothetical protein